MTRVQTFEYKLPGMRKPDNFIVYPRSEDGTYVVQGSRSILKVSPDSTKGSPELSRRAVANTKGSNPKYFMHLTKFLGAVDLDLPQEFINHVREFAPASGDLIGNSPTTGPVYLS
jgi:hypothetical protein